MPFSHKTQVGCYTIRGCMALTGATFAQISDWSLLGLLHPTVAPAQGIGNWRYYDATDILRIRICLELRRLGIGLHGMRPILAAMREVRLEALTPESFLVLDGEAGAAVVMGAAVIAALQRSPRGAFALPIGKLAEELKRGLHAA